MCVGGGGGSGVTCVHPQLIQWQCDRRHLNLPQLHAGGGGHKPAQGYDWEAGGGVVGVGGRRRGEL
jgi:hypothetical protein